MRTFRFRPEQTPDGLRFRRESPFNVPVEDMSSKLEYTAQKILSATWGFFLGTSLGSFLLWILINFLIYNKVKLEHRPVLLVSILSLFVVLSVGGLVYGFFQTFEGPREDHKKVWNDLPLWPPSETERAK